MFQRIRCYVLVLVALVALGTTAQADWPQILGPARDGISTSKTKLAATWPPEGPRVLWSSTCGQGYAGPAIVDDMLYLYQRVDDQETVSSYRSDGTEKRKLAEFSTAYRSDIAPDNGPRCVPLIVGDRVVLYSATGVLRCLERKTGQEIWKRETRADFKAPEGYFGFGSTPLHVPDPAGDRIVVNVGGPKGAGVVAFALADGTTAWQAVDDTASYSAPILTTIAGKPRVVCVTRLLCVLLDPLSGKELSKIPFGARGPTVNAATPVVVGDHLFLTASYGVGAAWVKLTADTLTLEWTDDDLLSSQYTTPILHRGLLYGIHGRQDVGVAELRCIDPANKKVLWKEEGFGSANLILADDKLIVVKIDGEGVLVEPTGAKYSPLATAKLEDDIVQALPAYDEGLLFIRSARQLRCFDLRAKMP